MEGEYKKPGSRELTAIEYLAALDSQLVRYQDVLRERLSSIPKRNPHQRLWALHLENGADVS